MSHQEALAGSPVIYLPFPMTSFMVYRFASACTASAKKSLVSSMFFPLVVPFAGGACERSEKLARVTRVLEENRGRRRP